jgi:integral membrane protein
MSKIKQFRMAAYIEGWSFIILLFVAMPLKYIMGIAIATKIVGMLHGVLFIWFLLALGSARAEKNQDAKFVLTSIVASLVPFGTFFLDKKILKQLDNNSPIFSK